MSAPTVKTNAHNNSTMMPMNMVAPKQPSSASSEAKQPFSATSNSFQVNNTQESKETPPATTATQDFAAKLVHNGTEQQTKAVTVAVPEKKEEPVPAAPTIAPPAITIPTPSLSLSNNVPTTLNIPTTPRPVKPAEKPAEPVEKQKTPNPEKKEEPIKVTPPASKVEEKKPVEKKPVPVEPAVKEAVTPVKAPVTPAKVEESLQKVETPRKTTPVKQQTPKPPAESPEKPEKVEPIEVKATPPKRAPKRKSEETKKTKETVSTPDLSGSKARRARTQTTPYQSPIPEMQQIVKVLKPTKPATPKQAEEKLIVFYKNEFMAVRNTEGSFYVCQAMQNIYKTSKKIKIRWLSQDKHNGEIYSPDFYDHTDFDCILTNLNLNKVEKNMYQLTKYELLRTENILKRAIDVEAGVSERPDVTEENNLGLDLSLYTDEAQLQTKKKGGKKVSATKGSKKQKRASKGAHLGDSDESESEEDSDRELTAGPSPPRKGPSRAERLLNRSKGPAAGSSGTSSQAATPSTSKKKATPAPAVKKAEVKKPATPVAAPAKPVVSPATPSTSGTQPRTTKSRGPPARSATEPHPSPSAPAGGRQKRAAPAIEEASTSRKKPRGRS